MRSNEERLSLLHRWLECNEEAGVLFWEMGQQNGLFHDYLQIQINIGKKALKKYGRFIEKIDLEGYATDNLYDIFGRFKRSDKNKDPKKPDDFKTFEAFNKYMWVSLNGIRDILKKIMGIDSISKKTEEYNEDNDDRPDIFSPENMCERQRFLQHSDDMFQTFRQFLKGALKEYLDQIIEMKGEDGSLEVITFLESSYDQDPEIHNVFIEKGMSQTNFNQRTRRLRAEWRKFREGKGSKDWAEYVEMLRDYARMKQNSQAVILTKKPKISDLESKDTGVAPGDDFLRLFPQTDQTSEGTNRDGDGDEDE